VLCSHGCDFLGICSNPSTIDQFRRGEVINGRFAMLGTVGMLVPEILARSGVPTKGAIWWETGSAMLHEGKLNYFGVPVPFGLQTVIIVNAALVFLTEWFRWQEFAPGYEPRCDDTLYPGGAFDPLGLSDDPDSFAVSASPLLVCPVRMCKRTRASSLSTSERTSEPPSAMGSLCSRVCRTRVPQWLAVSKPVLWACS